MKNNKSTATKSVLDTLSDIFLSPERIFAALISSFMLAYILQMHDNKNFFELQNYYSSISFSKFWFVTIFAFFMLCAVTYITKWSSLIPRSLLVTTTVLSCQYASSYLIIDGGKIGDNAIDGRVFFLLGIALVDFIVIKWLVNDDKLELHKIKINYKTCLIAACALFLASTIYFGYVTAMRYKSFTNYTFDFGIFAQMFENMATTGKPLTTVERSMEMSHFGVHFSPIFYLLLPGYMIFRTPVYLLYAQAACVAAGVFATYLICKKLELSERVTLLFEVVYCLYPALFNGCFYDFHENKLLTTIILFLFYFIISEKRIPTYVFSLMLLMVKEDAAIYLIVIALYVIINRKKYLDGSVMAAMAVLYFIIANKIVAANGTEGVMMWRLNDYFVNGEETYSSVFKSILFDLGYLIKMMFVADKIPFIIWMFLPVFFTPFATKKLSSLILLLPIIPINLMQTWKYQYNIDYQYSYGIAALIIVSAIFCIMDMKKRPRHIALLMALVVSISMFGNIITEQVQSNKSYVESYSEHTDEIDEMLKSIDKNASVTASDAVMPHLYFVKTIYSIPEHNAENKKIDKTDYYVVDTRFKSRYDAIIREMGNNYQLVDSCDFVQIYKLK